MTTTAERLCVALGLVLALAGCGSGGSGGTGGSTPEDGGTSSAPVGETPAPRVDADVTSAVRYAGGVLEVTWRLENRSGAPLLVADRPTQDVVAAGPGRVYVVGTTDGLVQLSQRVFARPADDDSDYATEFRIGLTQVPPGASLRRELSVVLPLAESKPYPDSYAEGEAPLPAEPTGVEFCLGVLAPPYDDLPLETVTPEAGEDDGGLLGYHGDTAGQALFCSDPVAAPTS